MEDDNMKYQCEYCLKKFCDKSTLKKHHNRKTACIIVSNNDVVIMRTKINQLEMNVEKLEDNVENLEETIDNLKDINVKLRCIIKAKEEEIQDLKAVNKKFDEMQDKLVACVNKGQPITNYNNIIIINNPKPFGPECFDINKFDVRRHLMNGERGFIDFVMESITLDALTNSTNYVCMDASRNMCKMLNQYLIWDPDVNADYFCETISKVFQGRTQALLEEAKRILEERDMSDVQRCEIYHELSTFLAKIKNNDASLYKKLLKYIIPKLKTTNEQLKLIEFR